MFTPQRKTPWTPPSSAARITTTTTRLTAAEKGKSLAFIDSPPPPPPRTDFVRRGENMDDWKRFKEGGLLDESSLQIKDSQALLDKISKLEKELFDYQYNMGLLLIEKKDLVSKNEDLGQEFAEVQEILKREKTAYLMAISEAEQREENLKKALGAEKKCLVDLERALREMHAEHEKFKASSETSVSDVNTHMETLEKKRRDLDAKVHVADAKLATAERKNSELDRKLQDLADRERILQRERLSLEEEKEAHQTYFQKHKKDLIEWEKKLEEGEQKLCDSRRILKEREEMLHDIDRTSKEKEAYMGELQEKIESADATLKKLELDLEIRLADLDSKEKKAEAMRCKLEMTEMQLLEKEERLRARESVELENLLSKHKIELDAKAHEFELEMKKKRNSMEEEHNTRMQEIDAKTREIKHLEDMLGKREQALEKKAQRIKEKEESIDGKIKALKEREKTVKSEEKTVELEKKAIIGDKEGLEDLRKELELWRTNLRKQEFQIEEEKKELEVLQEERSNYIRLQTNLKQEFEIARRQSELIEKEAGELKLEREKFEKDWEALDEKRESVDSKLKLLDEERASFEKLQKFEEDRLKRESAEREDKLRLESERIRLEKESFEASMEHRKKTYDEKAKNEHTLMLQDLERERQDFYNDVEKRRSELEKTIDEKERAFEERNLQDLGKVSRLKEDVEREMKDLENERVRLEKEREEMELMKKQIEETRIEMSSDVQTLGNLSKTMKKQREKFTSERRLFFAFIEQIKGCRNCGDSAQAFLHRKSEDEDESSPIELSTKTPLSPPALNRNNLESVGQMSVLRKCASIIFKSPKDSSQPTDDPIAEKSQSSIPPLTASKNGTSGIEYGLDDGKIRAQSSAIDGRLHSIVNDSVKKSPSDVNVREDSIDTAPSVQESENTGSKTSRRKPGKKRGPVVRRARSVKMVVEDAKANLGEEGSTGKMEEVSNQDDSVGPEIKPPGGARKRSRLQASRVTESEQDHDHSEGIADSATTGGRKKRRQTGVAASQTPGQRRYNLRRHTAVDPAIAEQPSSGKPKKEDEAASKGTDHTVQNPEDMPAPSLDVFAVDSGSKVNLVDVSTPRSIEISSHRIVKFSASDNQFDNAAKSLEIEEVKDNEDVPDDDGVNICSDSEGEDGSGDEDGSDGHPGQKSIGKKLWTFFTT